MAQYTNAAARRTCQGDYTQAKRLVANGWTLVSPYDGKTWSPGSTPVEPDDDEWDAYLRRTRRSRSE